MADDDNPTIPEIVRALITMDDRHTAALRKQADDHETLLKRKNQSIQTADRLIERRDAEVALLRETVQSLCNRIERTCFQLRQDRQRAVYSDPQEILHVLDEDTSPDSVIRKTREARAAARPSQEETVDMEESCRICGHPEDRHTRSLPEEGSEEYCGLCFGLHAFDGSPAQPTDECVCGCPRVDHLGTQCRNCLEGRHSFVMKTAK